MPFLLMVFLTVVCLPEAKEWPRPLWMDVAGTSEQAALAWSAVLTGLGVLLAVLNARRISRGLIRGLRGDPGDRDVVLRRYERGRTRHLLFTLAVYVLSLVGLGWGWTVDHIAQGMPATEVLVLAPFLLAELLSWAIFYDADRACSSAPRPADLDPFGLAGRETEAASFGSRTSHVLFQARQKLALVFLPVALLIIHKELHRLFPEEGRWGDVANVAGCVTLAAVFLTLPWVVRLLLGLRPLPDGPLRNRLLASSRRLGFRCSNLLVWNTRSGMANAMVIGLLPWVRYVVFTDRLLEDFSPDEVEAVFGHEVGHVKHQHMVYYLGFLLGSVFLLGSLAQMADRCLTAFTESQGEAAPWQGWLAVALKEGSHSYLAFLPLVAILLSYIFVVFGFLSRRCERQADVFGCRAVSCGQADCPGHDTDTVLVERGRSLCPTGIRTFIRALEKVAQVNGISRDRPGFLQSWQHSTIARRVEFLQRVLSDPAQEGYFQRRVAAVKWALLAVLGTTLYLVYALAARLPAPPE